MISDFANGFWIYFWIYNGLFGFYWPAVFYNHLFEKLGLLVRSAQPALSSCYYVERQARRAFRVSLQIVEIYSITFWI